MFARPLLAIALLSTGYVFGQEVSDMTTAGSCSSSKYRLDDEFAGGNMGDCRVLGESIFELNLKPEDEPPINPSPWYGIRITRLDADVAGRIRVTLRYPQGFEHRYPAKFSRDQLSWTLLPEEATAERGNGVVDLIFEVSDSTTYIAAQENLNVDWYREFGHSLQLDWPDLQDKVVGHSHAKRSIIAYETNPAAKQFVLLLGRSHPPEVPGAMALNAFIGRLAEIRRDACVYGTLKDCRFFTKFNFVVVPLLNPDGVVLGHWRHNLGSTDLNRDWGPLEQPETRAVVEFVERLESSGSKLRAMLDFHSTNRNVLYTQTNEDQTDPPTFAKRWFDRVAEATPFKETEGFASGFEHAERELSNLGTSKNFFFRRNGIPSITFESGDETDRMELIESVSRFADAFAMLLSEEEEMRSLLQMHASERGNACVSAFERLNPCEDYYCFLLTTNAASMLALHRADLLSDGEVASFSATMLQAEKNATEDTNLRVSDYLKLESQLIEIGGLEVTNIHLGRSRQDMHGTVRRMLVRHHWLQALDSHVALQRKLVDLAERHRGTVIPAYTHGVPSQPTGFGHLLIAYANSLSRSIARLQEGYIRLNKAPLGSSVGNTGSVAIDRKYMADLLGFDAPVANSFDANFISPLDYRQEIADILAGSAAVVQQLLANVHSQQRNPWPWIYVSRDEVSQSSSMPQKRNPRSLDRLRTTANDVLTLAMRTRLRSHNVDAGMHDYRLLDSVTDIVSKVLDMNSKLSQLLDSLVVDQERALQEINNSFAASAQIADLLHEETELSFRQAQDLTAAVVDYAREKGRLFHQLTQRDLNTVARDITGSKFPVSRSAVMHVIDPIYLVASRKGLGGPQLAAIDDQISSAKNRLNETDFWLMQSKSKIIEAEAAMQSLIFDSCSLVKKGEPVIEDIH